MPRLVQYVLKYVAPVYLFLIFVVFCWQSLPGRIATINGDAVALGSVAFIVTILLFLLNLVRIAGRRWERDGRLKYD